MAVNTKKRKTEYKRGAFLSFFCELFSRYDKRNLLYRLVSLSEIQYNNNVLKNRRFCYGRSKKRIDKDADR